MEEGLGRRGERKMIGTGEYNNTRDCEWCKAYLVSKESYHYLTYYLPWYFLDVFGHTVWNPPGEKKIYRENWIKGSYGKAC